MIKTWTAVDDLSTEKLGSGSSEYEVDEEGRE